ncbi:HIT-like domain-containing protein [Amylocarpus encephaloides]|uniref:Aprataxin-like protein n=1 Tax=Amylocarpus encephaloides TaxID=45428 RepID=A0A9P8C7C0_9HELO|nr:HIT-like domain-containing protein [Amylocarpus encephaloides]
MTIETPQDATAQGEIDGTATAVPSCSTSSPSRNAFTTLMTSTKRKLTMPPPSARKSKHHFASRDGLSAYTKNPSSYPSSRVIFHDESFVAIHDLYPKSSVHTLLLPRSEELALLHPFDAFADAEFLAQCRVQAAKLKGIVGKELQRRYGLCSKQDSGREAILSGEVELGDAEDLPIGRDWEKDIRVGIHAHPSMNHLHIHVLSVDRYSECMRYRKHYNSFATPFFVPLEDFPLAEDDVRRHPTKEGYMGRELKCWRCGRGFGNKFVELKAHLEEEFEEWKKE